MYRKCNEQKKNNFDQGILDATGNIKEDYENMQIKIW